MSGKSVRIKDIALKAGVSTGTVDRVIHNRGKVAEDVREKVLKIIEEMQYEPNLIARALGANKTYRLGALIPDPSADSYWLEPRAGVEKAEKALRHYGVSVTRYMFDPYSIASFQEQADALLAGGYDGVVISPVFYKESLPYFEALQQAGIPFVIFNSQISEYTPLSYIGSDLYTSGLLAGKLFHYGVPGPCTLLVAHIDEHAANASHLGKKEKGFRNYFAQHLLEEQYNVVSAELDRSNKSAFIAQLDALIEDHPRLGGIFVTTSKAYSIASYLEQRRISHIKVVGYDLLPQNLQYLQKEQIHFLINQGPFGQGYWSVYYLAEHVILGREIPLMKYMPLDIVTRENVNYYLADHDETPLLERKMSL